MVYRKMQGLYGGPGAKKIPAIRLTICPGRKRKSVYQGRISIGVSAAVIIQMSTMSVLFTAMQPSVQSQPV